MQQWQPAVTDATIWIDLEGTGLLPAAFELSLRYSAPDLIVAQLGEPTGSVLKGMGLNEEELSESEVGELLRLNTVYRAPGHADLSTIVLAQRLQAILLTGDAALRKAAEKEGLEVHGVLWLLDCMVAQRCATPAEALAGLDFMQAKPNPARLPTRQCERYRRLWQAEDKE